MVDIRLRLLLVIVACVQFVSPYAATTTIGALPNPPNHRELPPVTAAALQEEWVQEWLLFTGASNVHVEDDDGNFDFASHNDMYTKEREALLDFYYATGGDQWIVQWDIHDTEDHCSWYGINCSTSGRVQKLILGENGLRGTIPASIKHLESLQIFQLIGNRRLKGDIPSEIGLLGNLTNLNLQWNNLRGTIPSELSKLHSLHALDLSFNSLKGTIPSEFSALQELLIMILATNSLTGSLPTSFSRLSSLIILDVGTNKISGSVPESIVYNMTSLRYLLFDTNLINGTIPSQMGEMNPDLQMLYMGSNQLQGSLPTGFGKLLNLRQLFMDSNELDGTIPTEWAALSQCKNFIALDLSNNQLSGSIPTFISTFRNLTVLRLSNNYFTDCPEEIFGLLNVVTLALQYNPLGLTFIPRTPPLGFIIQLDVSNTGLNADIRSLPSGQYAAPIIRLSDNHGLYGSIDRLPLGLDNGVIFTELYISNTSVRGIIPNMNDYGYRHLQVLDVSLNPGITGPLPISWLRSASQLTLNVTGVDLISDYEVLKFTNDTHVIQDKGYLCHRLLWPSPNVQVVGLDPAYYKYDGCFCLPGYSGAPPKCKLIHEKSDRPLIAGLSAFVAILLSTLAVLLRRRIRRWFVLRRELRNAQKMLSEYADLLPPSVLRHGGRHASHFPSSTELNDILTFGGNGEEDEDGQAPHLADALNALKQDWTINHSDIVIVRSVASGSTAEVSLGLWRHAYVAVKRFHAGMMTHEDRKRFAIESALHVQLRHPNIVQLLGVCLDPLCTVTEWMERGSLYSVLQTHPTALIGPTGSTHPMSPSSAASSAPALASGPGSPLPEAAGEARGGRGSLLAPGGGEGVSESSGTDEGGSRSCLDGVSPLQRTQAVVRVALDIARGMSYLHSKGVLHRDLKSLNVLLNSAGVAKVADFGHARVATEKTMTVAQGTAAWMAPEVFESGYYSTKCDVYSYGIVLYELCTMEIPFDSLKFAHQVQGAVISGERPQLRGLAEYMSDDEELLALVEKCWHQDPEVRPSFDEIVDVLEAKDEHTGLRF